MFYGLTDNHDIYSISHPPYICILVMGTVYVSIILSIILTFGEKKLLNLSITLGKFLFYLSQAFCLEIKKKKKGHSS